MPGDTGTIVTADGEEIDHPEAAPTARFCTRPDDEVTVFAGENWQGEADEYMAENCGITIADAGRKFTKPLFSQERLNEVYSTVLNLDEGDRLELTVRMGQGMKGHPLDPDAEEHTFTATIDNQFFKGHGEDHPKGDAEGRLTNYIHLDDEYISDDPKPIDRDVPGKRIDLNARRTEDGDWVEPKQGIFYMVGDPDPVSYGSKPIRVINVVPL